MSDAAPEPKANMGQPVARIDGRAKVTGEARYGSDMPLRNPAFTYLLTSTIAKGRITGFDFTEAKRVRGLIEIVTHENAEKLKTSKFNAQGGYASTVIQPLNAPEIFHEGQIIGIVIAESFEAARDASHRIKVSYDQQTPAAGFDAQSIEIRGAKGKSAQFTEDPSVGDFDKAFADAEVKLEASYETPTQHHNPMELFQTSCEWDGDRLTIYESTQSLYGHKNGVAEQLGIDPEKVRVISPYIGGAFGSKGAVTPRSALIASIARKLNRPVKLVVSRDQGFTTVTHRAETRHDIKLGATKAGKLTALSHRGLEVTSRTDDYVVGGTSTTTRMYGIPNVTSLVSLVAADRNTPGFMRSPPEVPYVFALESAIDEMAVKLNIDPVELRRMNDTDKEMIKGTPFTSRSLMRCYDEAAAAFGWSKRDAKPQSMSDGDWWIGWGCATAIYPSLMAPAAARVRFQRDGRARVEIAGHEIGTGAYTVIAQMAAERLGIAVDKVEVIMGDSNLPPTTVAGGSNSTASTCSAVMLVCDQIRQKLFKAVAPQESVIDKVKETVGIGETASQKVAKSDETLPREEAFDRLGVSMMEEYGEWKPDGAPSDSLKALHAGQTRMVGGHGMKGKVAFAFGAEFVELRVHKRTREIRVPRMVGAFAGGRIMNPRTARSQLMGGMIWGVSSALHEATEIDTRTARYVNDNLADYMIPVNADIAEVNVIMVPEVDDQLNPAGIKGLGELGNVGTNAAIANALFHATGQRIRRLPIRIEDILGS